MSAAPLLPTRDELRALLTLAVPVVTVQVGMMLMGVVDTLMVGHVSPAALAAVALGNLYFFAVAIFGMGVLMGLDPIIAQAVGAQDAPPSPAASSGACSSPHSSSLPAMLLLWPAGSVFAWLEQPADVVPLAATYARLVIPGVLPFLVYAVLRQTLQAMGRLRAIVITIVAANLLNVLLNYALVYGHFGLPPLGVAGSSIATTCSRWIMALVLLGLSWPVLRRHLLPIRPEVLRLAPLNRMLRLGAPIGVQFELEYGAFGLTGRADGPPRHQPDGGAPGGAQPRVAHLHGAPRRLGCGGGPGRAGGRARRREGRPPLGADGARGRRHLHGRHRTALPDHPAVARRASTPMRTPCWSWPPRSSRWPASSRSSTGSRSWRAGSCGASATLGRR